MENRQVEISKEEHLKDLREEMALKVAAVVEVDISLE